MSWSVVLASADSGAGGAARRGDEPPALDLAERECAVSDRPPRAPGGGDCCDRLNGDRSRDRSLRPGCAAK
ncbi:hypothetical protein, partial [Streptomyces sp.]|uniref:hypothetical protein n=1 Tax=Streptomyces sp. TaxID=1931 RepID=UPI002F417593